MNQLIFNPVPSRLTSRFNESSSNWSTL